MKHDDFIKDFINEQMQAQLWNIFERALYMNHDAFSKYRFKIALSHLAS